MEPDYTYLLHHIEVAVLQGKEEWRGAILVRQVDARALPQQLRVVSCTTSQLSARPFIHS